MKPTDAIRSRVLQSMKEVISKDGKANNRMKFAVAIGTTASRISNWESGVGHPTVENIHLLCKTFEVSPAWIILGKESKEEKAIDSMNDRLRTIEKMLNIKH